ncbi:DUF1127 domain-containing protein [uncultured Jannaschia sp.]|uniref:DUF1127 domain-containing protein n=1 Tax=uncultured Jannaschia sp. TaxID=293347 RepID=UPI0026030894|nr:DUF1127 domain-containing protein [uncultured Jannaschia sp.]
MSVAARPPVLDSMASPPAFPLAAALVRAGAALALWERRARTRRHLRAVPPERLADLGLTPREVSVELAKGFWRA